VIRLAFTLAATLAPGLVAAQSFDGVYQSGSCGAATDGRVEIAGNRISFWESTCQLTNPVSVRDMGDGTLFDVVCTGEGETWSYRMFMMQGAEGLIMVRDGYAFTYPRCG
jgi:hypothetical protein